MDALCDIPSSTNIPEIVPIVLTQADRQRRAGTLSEEIYDNQVRRLVKEELEPRRLTLLIRGLADGRTRFLIKCASSGQVRGMFESEAATVAA